MASNSSPLTAALPLYSCFPRLEAQAPRVALCDLPTPVVPMPLALATGAVASLHVKRDDLTAAVYGGNKVRKLEFLLGQALRRGAKETITFGYAGSNHALATAIYAAKVGLRPVSILLPQANAHYVRRNLRAGHAAGAKLIARTSVRAIATTVACRTILGLARDGRRPFVIPAGGSSALGVLGYVNAALEFADQIHAGLAPFPDRVYVSLGSMGTAAGLALGFAIAGLATEIHAVRVVDRKFASREGLYRLLEKTFQTLMDFGAEPKKISSPQLVVRDEFFGTRYGEFTEGGVRAVRTAMIDAALRLDGTYSGKALAALIEDVEKDGLRGKHILFWNTHNSRDVGALGSGVDYHDLPRAFHRYFEEPVQTLDPGA